MYRALSEYLIRGIKTTIPLHKAIMADPVFIEGKATTAYMEDFYAKLDRAIAAARHGFAYLHVYSPCTTGWRFPAEKNIEVARRAVECNFVTLWEFTPEAGLRFTRDPDRPRPLADYLSALGKFRHLSADQVGHLENHLAENVKRLRGLAREPATA